MKMKKISNIYKKRAEERNGGAIWIVDGASVRREFYTDFVMGGHDGRYRFIPSHEVWIDNALSLEEFEYTIEHELLERKLMVEDGLNYNDAHDRASHLEFEMRKSDFASARAKEENSPEIEEGTWFVYGKE